MLENRTPESIQLEKDIIAIVTAAIYRDDKSALDIIAEYDATELITPLVGVILSFLLLAGKDHLSGPDGLIKEWAMRIVQYEALQGMED